MSAPWRDSWRAASAALLLLALASTGADAANGALRGYQVPDQPAPAAKPSPLAPAPAAPAADPGVGPPPLADLSPIPRFQDDPAPRFNLDPAPRTQGLDQGGGGAACRTACAQSRYQCLVEDENDLCDGAWSQCVASCAESSSAPL